MFHFLVSQPSSSRSKISGYKAFKCKNDMINPLPLKTSDEFADKNNIIQKFCYLRPQNRQICAMNDSNSVTDSSDYMLIAKNNGIVEIIRNYSYKLRNELSLRPDYLLICVPQIENVITHDVTIVGLEYRDKFLFICSSIGDLFGFVLNLPDDYIQDHAFLSPKGCHNLQDSITWKGATEALRNENLDEIKFRELTEFVRTHKYCHICYYCYPVSGDEYLHECLRKWYPEPIPTFSNCFAVFFRTDVSSFHINPMDRFSVITVAPHVPLTIHKILLPSLYVEFYREFINLKRAYFSRFENKGEPKSFDAMSHLIYGPSFTDYLKNECTSFVIEQDVRVWRTILVCDMVCEFKYSSVWRQKQGNIKDALHRLFFYEKSSDSKVNSNTDVKTPSDRAVELELDSDTYMPLQTSSEPILNHLHGSEASKTEKFLKYLRKKTFPVDFQAVRTVSLNSEVTENEATTSFLTDTYKDMDLVIIHKFLGIDVFRPKYVDEPLMKIDSVHDYGSLIMNEYKAQSALNNLAAFKKFFMLTDSLCLIWDINGLLLMDRFNLRSTAHLLDNDVGVVKIIPFHVGIVNDIGLVVTNFHKVDCDYIIEFYAVITSLTGHIILLKGCFNKDERMGKIRVLDSLKLKEKDKFVDQIVLIDYEHGYKRAHSNLDIFCPNKRSKRLGVVARK